MLLKWRLIHKVYLAKFGNIQNIFGNIHHFSTQGFY
jgi:hypothetical protein